MKIRLLTLIAFNLAILPSPTFGAQPWDEPFAKDAKAIAQAARLIARPDHPELIVLLDEYRYTVHADGRMERTHRKVYRVQQQAAVEYSSNAEQSYQPWYQKKPEVRARVIGPDGEVHALDLKTVGDAPAGDPDATIYSDARVIRAPLPSVSAESVVEYEFVTQDTTPLLDAGVTEWMNVSLFQPLERFHIIVEADTGAALRLSAKLIPESAIHRSESGKGTRIECDFGPFDPPKHFEGNLPPEVPGEPYLAFSTGKSWQSVATRYASIVDQKLQAADWKQFLDGIDLKGEPRVVAARLAAKLHKSVRYTGVEFGEAAIVPGAPADTIKRGYGDCKDKSTLLVAMLRSAGLKADVALLHAGYDSDVDPDLPGMGVFNHAIVHVASDPPMWIDATAAETRVGFLPAADQGRLALIADGASTALVKVPESRSEDNQHNEIFEIRMGEFGNGSVHDIFVASGGSAESNARATYRLGDEKLKEQLEKIVKQSLAAKSMGKYEVSRADDLEGPFRMELEALDSRLSATGLDDASVQVAPWSVFTGVPYTLRQVTDSKDEHEQARKHDFLFPEPHRMEIRYKIIPPPLFKVANVPESRQIKLGTGTYTKNYKTNEDGSFEAIYQFDTGKRRLSPEEFETYRSDLQKYIHAEPELFTFYPETAEYVALGQSGKALALVREAVAAHPDSAMARVRLSHTLLIAHLGGPAVAEARKATELDPKSGIAWQSLAVAYENDTFGRTTQGNWNRVEAEKAFRKALELNPDDAATKMALAILMEFNDQGWRYAKDSRLNEAIALYREILKDPQMGGAVRQNLAVTLLRAGKLSEAKEEAKKGTDAFQAVLLSMISAIQDGAARAIVNSQTGYPDPAQRAQFLTNVAVSLLQMRRYSESQAIFSAAARMASIPGTAERAEMLSKIKRWDDTLVPEDDPRWPVQRLMLEMLRGNLKREVLQPLLAKATDLSTFDRDVAEIQSGLATLRQQLSVNGMQEESAADIALSMMNLAKEGDDQHGYRITGHIEGSSGMPALYVIREDEKYKLIGAGSDGVELVGALVLDLLSKKDLAGAQWWLDQVQHDVQARADGTGLPVIKSLWSGVTPEFRNADAARLAAQVLIATSTGKPEAIQKLTLARPKAANVLDRAQIDKAICESLVKGKNWEGLMAAARQLQASRMFSEEGFRYYLMGAKGAHKWVELAAEAKKRYDGNPLNEAAVKALVLAAAGQGNWTSAAEWAKKVAKSGIFQIEQAETEAWTAILAGKATEESLTALHKVKDNGGKLLSYQYTDAMLQASLHLPEGAMEALIRSIAGQDDLHLHPAAWLAYARICVQYGYPDEAAKAVTMARTTSHPQDDLTDWVDALLASQKN